MSRFNKLEFGEESDGQLQATPQPGNRQSLFKDEDYYLTEAQGAFEGGQFERALRHYAKVLEFNPKNPAAWAGQVRMLIELNKLDDAKRWVDQALERFPNEPELLAAKAVVCARTGDLTAALAYSDAAIGEQGETPYVWLARGDVQLARAEKCSDNCFQRAFTLAPKDWFIRWLAARVHYYYHKMLQTLKLIQEAMALNATHGVLWMQMGFCQAALGLIEPARTSFQHARQFEMQSREADEAIRSLRHVGFWTRVSGRCRQLFDR